MIQGKLYINGTWQDGRGELLSSYDSASGELLWQAHKASHADIVDAIDSGQKALTSWKKLTVSQRAAFLHRFCIELEKNKAVLAETISQEVGKPLWEARQEIQAVKGKIDISIKAYKERTGERKENFHNHILRLRHEPHGLCAVFGPFNFPAHLPQGHIVPALLAGNTILFKPSEKTARTGELLVELWHKTRLPHGVLNLVYGTKEEAKQIIEDPRIKGIYFTGSFQAGQEILRASLDFPDRIVALEMGGNNPLVVGTVQNIDAAVLTIIQSAFVTSGQRCTAARRLIIIENDASQALLDSLVRATKKIVVGYYTDRPEPYMGPVISEEAAHGLLAAHIRLLQLGGKSLLEPTQEKRLVTPGIIDMTGCPAYDEEIFGPLLQCIRVQNLDEAIVCANSTSYGLSSAILTDIPSEYDRFSDDVRAGVINWNMPTTGASSTMAFGGIGKSGNFRPSAYYAADYSAYPVVSQEQIRLQFPRELPPGLEGLY